jgi:hypothetical protein
MRRTLSALLAPALGLALAAPASGQEPTPWVRGGFWSSFGLGYGSAHLRCGTTAPPYGCSDTTVSGVTGFLRMGTSLRPDLLVGGELGGWYREYESGGETSGEVLASLSAVVMFFPKAGSGLFLKGGLGLSSYYFSPGGASVRGVGWGAVAGVGYDISVGGVAKYFVLTPTVDLTYGAVGDLESGGATFAKGWRQTVLSVGLGVTFP